MAKSTQKASGRLHGLKDGVNKEHWFYALNALAEEPDGDIISSNLADKLKLKVGDTFKLYKVSAGRD